MQIGSKIYYKNLKGITSRIQQIVLDTKFSHLSLYYGKDEYDYPLEFEANLEVEASSYLPVKAHQDIYEWIDVPEAVLRSALMKIKPEYEFKEYGYISWLAILLRRIFELFGFNAKKWNILWGWGIICSELIWYFNTEVADRMIKLKPANLPDWSLYRYELSKYNPNLFTPKDDFQLCEKYNSIFKRG